MKIRDDMFKVAYHSTYPHSLPDGHRFPMTKYSLLHAQLMWEGIVDTDEWIHPSEIPLPALLRCHSPDYISRLESGHLSKNEQRKSGFPWSAGLIAREKTIMEGTRLCGRVAAKGGVALNIAGGTHHAHAAHAEGFCLLNDLVISAYDLLDAGFERVLIVDLDVHQGNGTASMLADEPRIFTFSMHGAANYPMHKAVGDWDIALPDGTRDADYLFELERALSEILQDFSPQVALYQCGVDVLESDKLGRLALSMKGCQARDHIVLEMLHACGIGVACTMGGGYSERIATIVEAHMQTFRVARDLWT